MYDQTDQTETVTKAMETIQISEAAPKVAASEEGLWVSDVLEGSPAQTAGLQIGDKLVKFG